MEPILKKHEIAHLLTAIKDGLISLDVDNDDRHLPNLDFTPIDLTNLPRAKGEQFRVPNFDIILDNFSRTYSTALTNKLQRTFLIRRTSLESSEFRHFFKDRSTLGAFGVIDMSPLRDGALIILEPDFSFSLIEIMLGASTEVDPLKLERQLTTIELVVLKSLFDEACNAFNKAFAQILNLQSTLVKLENNARLVSIVEPEVEVIIGTFKINVEEVTGEIHMLFPYSTLEPLRDLLKELLTISKVSTGNWHDVIKDEILEVPAAITAQSGTFTLSISQLLDLKKGDLLDIHYDPNRPLNVLVENQHVCFAVPGTHNGKKAIRLTGVTK